MSTTTKISITFILLAGLIGTSFWAVQTSKISYINADYAFNVSNDLELVGFADNDFMGKEIRRHNYQGHL